MRTKYSCYLYDQVTGAERVVIVHAASERECFELLGRRFVEQGESVVKIDAEEP